VAGTNLAIECRYATSSSHAFVILDEYSDDQGSSSTLAAAIALETTLSMGVDNYN
jgi:hypothetical protein